MNASKPTNFKLLALSAIFFGLLIIAYWGGLAELVRRWYVQEEYGHGFFIPLLSAWIVWGRREAVAATIGQRHWLGYILFAIAFVMLVLGELAALFLLIQVSFILMIAAFCLLVGGWQLLKICIFPILFLFFAIPLPYFIDSTLSARLQLLSSDFGVDFLRLFGVPVFLQGNVIDLGLYQLQVVDACSGLRYMYPLMSLGVLAAYLFKAPFWQKLIIFLSTIPITIMMNSFRIGMIGVLVNIWGIEMADGALHFFEGWVIFMTCAIVLLAEIWIFNRLNGRSNLFDHIDIPKPAVNFASNPQSSSRVIPATIGAIVIMGVLVVSLQFLDRRDEMTPARRQLASFPLQIKEWSGKDQNMANNVIEKLGFEDYVLADFTNNDDLAPVNFYVAYYASQRKGVSPHSPRVCIPGGGWEITKFSRAQLKTASDVDIPINRLIIERERDKLLVFYWFDQRGKRFANEYLMKAHLLKDAVIDNRSDGALVRVTTPITSAEDLASAEARLSKFVNSILPILPEYVPGKTT